MSCTLYDKQDIYVKSSTHVLNHLCTQRQTSEVLRVFAAWVREFIYLFLLSCSSHIKSTSLKNNYDGKKVLMFNELRVINMTNKLSMSSLAQTCAKPLTYGKTNMRSLFTPFMCSWRGLGNLFLLSCSSPIELKVQKMIRTERKFHVVAYHIRQTSYLCHVLNHQGTQRQPSDHSLVLRWSWQGVREFISFVVQLSVN